MHPDWFDNTYLQRGTPRQQAAYEMLDRLRLFDILREYAPVLVGTIPIDINIPESDLDVICEVTSPAPFIQIVKSAFGAYDNFRMKQDVEDKLPIVVNFQVDDFPIEIYADDCPVTEQNAFVHMVVEYRLLCLAGHSARTAIRQLKWGGLKTEPAFAHHFGLTGDPYKTLLDLARLDDIALKTAVGLPYPIDETL